MPAKNSIQWMGVVQNAPLNSAAVMKDLIAANVSDFDQMSVQVANDE